MQNIAAIPPQKKILSSRKGIVNYTPFHKTKFSNFIKNLLINYSGLCLAPEGIQENRYHVYTLVITKRQKRFTQKSMKISLEKETGNISIKFFYGLARDANHKTNITKEMVIGLNETTKKIFLVKKGMKRWLRGFLMMRYVVLITFRSECNLFKYRDTLYTDNIGSPYAHIVIDKLFKKVILPKGPHEVKNFCAAYGKIEWMIKDTLRVRIFSLDTDDELPITAGLFYAELGLQICTRLFPEKKVVKEKIGLSYKKRISNFFIELKNSFTMQPVRVIWYVQYR